MKITNHDFNKNKLTEMIEVTKNLECQIYSQLGFTELIGEGKNNLESQV